MPGNWNGMRTLIHQRTPSHLRRRGARQNGSRCSSESVRAIKVHAGLWLDLADTEMTADSPDHGVDKCSD